ncbi:dynein regulatory complex subunit 6 [Lampris incognitus]|uniref:dynein regulatory complex subunit 6 n=1 Tax=Lampris incognitus TaxID=2546036 RepID=UPI0024B4C1D8|nr:dynein regulatory complex subunit 6 [Lampris incognitus]
MASSQNSEPAPDDDIVNHSLPQIHQALLTAACLCCPHDPTRFLERKLAAFQGHHSLRDLDWGWRRLTAKRKRGAELERKGDMAGRRYERGRQRRALATWVNWHQSRKRTQAAAIEKLRRVSEAVCFRRVIVVWCNAVKESKRKREYFQLETGFLEMESREHQTGEAFDRLSMLPTKLSLKIFQYLQLQDRLRCAEVCCTWRALSHSGSLWSQINFSAERTWITDSIVKQILQRYRPFVIHLNLRGCTSLKWTALTCIGECRNLQELNLSECSNINVTMLQGVVEGCPNLLYLNLSCTLVTDGALRALSRGCVNLLYLSLAYCCKFTDKGLQYLSTGKGCHNLIHLDLSGCTQVTVDGFRYVSAGCPLLKAIVIDDMPTLSDGGVVALVARCHALCAVSLLDTPHLSDVAFKAIAEKAQLETFSTEGNSHVTDVSWRALCHSSRNLCRLCAAECSRMTDSSLKSMATLKNLQYLDISHCNRVGDRGVSYLTKGFSATKLRELNVSRCSRISDNSVRWIAQRLTKLNHLDLSHCKSLTDSSLECLSGSSISSLDISGCNIQDKGLSALKGVCLKKLVLAECVYITDVGIEKLCKRVRDLEHLDVSHCVTLTDQAVRALSFYCTGLLTLRMADCPKMTDMATHYLTGGAHYLRELDVSGCVRLTDRTLCLLESNCPPLGSVTMAFCSGISRIAALRLRPRVQYWEHSSDDPPYWFGYNTSQMRGPGNTGDEEESPLSEAQSRNFNDSTDRPELLITFY